MAAFNIDGRDYPVPSVFQLTMGEAQVLYEYSGYTLEEFVPPAPGEPDTDRARMVGNPAFKRAMVHIAYQRGNPDMARDDVAKAVDGMQMWDMILDMLTDDADPTVASQNEQPSSSGPGSTPTTPSSGRHSDTSSDEQVASLVRTGTTG